MEELKGRCKNCLGCMRLENKNFKGTNNCDETMSGLEMCKIILGRQIELRGKYEI